MSADPEAERPRNYREYISSDHSWEEVGIRIRWTEPVIPGQEKYPAYQPLRLRCCVETKKELQVPPEDISAWCWTPIVTKQNPKGIWKEILLNYNPNCTQWNDHGVTSYVFQSAILPESHDHYRITFNVKWKNIMVWNNQFQKDNIVDVARNPSRGTQTLVFPKIHFTSNYNEGQKAPMDTKKEEPVKEPKREPAPEQEREPSPEINYQPIDPKTDLDLGILLDQDPAPAEHFQNPQPPEDDVQIQGDIPYLAEAGPDDIPDADVPTDGQMPPPLAGETQEAKTEDVEMMVLM